jgi:diguanylate cyclase (GGDEF)-like protein/PAS domain S-box-containing protein
MSSAGDSLAVGPASLRKPPMAEILLGMALFAVASISIFLTKIPGGIALLWPASAIAAAVLIRLPRVRWVPALLSVLTALFLASSLDAHQPPGIAAGFACVNAIEIALMVAVFRFMWRFPYPDITIGQATVMVGILGIAIPGIAALFGGLLLHLALGKPWWGSTLQWWSSHTVGACLTAPPIILISHEGLRRLRRPRFLIENLGWLLAGLVGCYLTVRYVRFPFVAMSLMLTAVAFRVGGFGASLMSVSFGLLITNLWIIGVRPIGLDPTMAASSGTLLDLPVIAFLATVLPPIAVGLGSDARRSAGRDLRLSERRFRESMAYSPIGMLITQLDGVWTYSNRALQKMLGYTAEELSAMPPGGPSKTDEWKESSSRFNRLVAGEIDSYNVTRQFQHKDGRWVWTHVAVSILRDEDGAPMHLIAQIESLEARRQAEENLAAERERLKITLSAISDAVITTDASSCITYINATAQTLLGLDLKAVVDRRVSDVIHLVDPRTNKAAANLIGQSAIHGTVIRREQACLLHRADGTVCYVSDTVSPVLDSAGQLSGMVIVFRDATGEVTRGRELQHRALHDSLTGLSNRTDFNDRLREAFAKSHHLSRVSAVIAIDLDRFKIVNDTGGHAAGDAILCKVAEACRNVVRASDTVARLGGDEFALILENCAAERATRIANDLLNALNPIGIEWAGQEYVVNASLGLAMTSAQMADEKAWLEAADRACYLSKREGRGRLNIAGSELNAGHSSHRTLAPILIMVFLMLGIHAF